LPCSLKTKGNTPKYGLIYHSSFIGRTGAKSKGRISRFLANKCSIASRIDNFSETPTSKFGEALKRQVDERIEFYASGAPPAKNSAVMQAAMNAVMTDIGVVEDPTAAAAEDVEMADGVTAAATEQAVRKEKKEKKDKKEKKEKKAKTEEVSEKKEKKDKKRKSGDDDGEKKKKKSKA
jgi:nucleolar protein 56